MKSSRAAAVCFVADARDAALVQEERALGRRGGLAEQRGQLAFGARKVARPQRIERRRRSGAGLREEANRRESRNIWSVMFTIDVVTLFPEVFAPFVGLSIVGRAVEAGIVARALPPPARRAARRASAPTTALRRRRRDGACASSRSRARSTALLAERADAGERRAIVVPSSERQAVPSAGRASASRRSTG